MRESWIYAVAFLLILGGGAALLVPLALEGPEGDAPPTTPGPAASTPGTTDLDLPEDLGPVPNQEFAAASGATISLIAPQALGSV